MGALFMILITLVIIYALNLVMPLWVSIFLSIVFFLGWFWFNVRGATVGLARANMHVYFSSRKMGLNHEAALGRVLETRYPYSESRRQQAWSSFVATCRSTSEAEQLKLLVLNVFCVENGPPPPEALSRLHLAIEQEYVVQSTKHGWPLS